MLLAGCTGWRIEHISCTHPYIWYRIHTHLFLFVSISVILILIFLTIKKTYTFKLAPHSILCWHVTKIKLSYRHPNHQSSRMPKSTLDWTKQHDTILQTRVWWSFPYRFSVILLNSPSKLLCWNMCPSFMIKTKCRRVNNSVPFSFNLIEIYVYHPDNSLRIYWLRIDFCESYSYGLRIRVSLNYCRSIFCEQWLSTD